MQLINNASNLEQNKFYWVQPKDFLDISPKLLKCVSENNTIYLVNCVKDREESHFIFKHWNVLGPVELPSFENFLEKDLIKSVIDNNQLKDIIVAWKISNYPDSSNLKGYMDTLERLYTGRYNIEAAKDIINSILYPTKRV